MDYNGLDPQTTRDIPQFNNNDTSYKIFLTYFRENSTVYKNWQ